MDGVGCYNFPSRLSHHMGGPGIVDMTFLVNAMRLLAHASIEQEGHHTAFVVDADHEAAETVGHIGNLNQCGYPQRFVGGGVVDKIQELVSNFDPTRHG